MHINTLNTFQNSEKLTKYQWHYPKRERKIRETVHHLIHFVWAEQRQEHMQIQI